jgi:hypothetical protein
LFKVTEVPPGEAATEADPPHPADSDGETGLARKTLAGRLSCSEAPVSVVFEPFVIFIDNWLTPPAHMLLGLKLLLTVGAPIPVTFRVALAGLVVVMVIPPGPVDVNVRAGMVLIQLPGVLEVTIMDTVQLPGVDPD